MPATAMTLTLKLAGVSQLTQAINRLNQALKKLNQGFVTAAKQVDKAAQKMGAAVNAAKGKGFTGFGGGPGFGRSASGNPKNPIGQQDVGSIMFSAFAGQWRMMFAKAATRIATNFVNNKAFPQRPGGPPTPPPEAIAMVGKNLAGLATKLGLIVGAILLVIVAFKKLVEWINSTVKPQVQLFYSSFGNQRTYGQARGISAALDMSQEQMAAAMRGKPGPGQLINEIKTLRNIPDDLAAEQFARARGIEQFLPVRDLTESTWQNALHNTAQLSKQDRQSVAEFNAALGDMKNSFTNLAVAMTPVIRGIGFVVNLFARLVDLFTILSNIDFVKKLLDAIDELLHGKNKDKDKEDKKADKFGKAVDKFTNAVEGLGGGERGHNAIPTAWSYFANQKALINMSENLGSFEF